MSEAKRKAEAEAEMLRAVAELAALRNMDRDRPEVGDALCEVVRTYDAMLAARGGEG